MHFVCVGVDRKHLDQTKNSNISNSLDTMRHMPKYKDQLSRFLYLRCETLISMF